VANAAEGVWQRVAQPSQSRRQIACVQSASGALLDQPLVQLPSQFGDLGRAPRVGIGEARRTSPSISANAYQRGGEGVQSQTADASRPPICRQGGNDLLHFPDNLIRVYLRRAVITGREVVRNLLPTALDRTSRCIEDVSATCGRTDIDGQHKRIDGFAELYAASSRCHVLSSPEGLGGRKRRTSRQPLHSRGSAFPRSPAAGHMRQYRTATRPRSQRSGPGLIRQRQQALR
jgi:hypothetical protein